MDYYFEIQNDNLQSLYLKKEEYLIYRNRLYMFLDKLKVYKNDLADGKRQLQGFVINEEKFADGKISKISKDVNSLIGCVQNNLIKNIDNRIMVINQRIRELESIII